MTFKTAFRKMLNDVNQCLFDKFLNPDREGTGMANAIMGMLFASDVNENSKDSTYYAVCHTGECVAVAYHSKEIMEAFIKHLCRVGFNGRDMMYSAQMQTTDDIQGRVLCYTHLHNIEFVVEETLPKPEYISRAILANTSFEELLKDIKAEIGIQGVKIVVIDNLSTYAKKNGCVRVVRDLEAIAEECNVAILCGFEISKDSEGVADVLSYFDKHERKLCYLQEDEAMGTKFFRFHYGFPEQKQIIYTINENGNVVTPPGIGKYIMLKDALNDTLKQKSVNLQRVIDNLYGYFKGKYPKQTLRARLSEADCQEWGLFTKSGEGTKTTLALCDTTTTMKPYGKSVALDSFTDRYLFGKRKKVPFMKYGDFKLIAYYNCEQCARNIILEIANAVISGKSILSGKSNCGFIARSSHRNTLIVNVGSKSIVEQKIGKYIQASTFEGVCNVVEVEPGTADCDFVDSLNATIQKYNPDFVFILNLAKVDTSNYGKAHLAQELKAMAKRRQVAMIAENYLPKEDSQYDIDDSLCWVEPMICYDIVREHTTANLPTIYQLTTSTGKYPIMVRFDNSMRMPSAEKQKEIYLHSTFYDCNNVSAEEILCEDCNNRMIHEAKELWIVKVIGKGKERRITYCYRKP